jgi:hypothetical protein
MDHSFDVDDAVEHGVEKAVILHNLRFWIMKNMANEKNQYDDHTWTYNSSIAFERLFPYLSARKVARMLRELEEDGVLISGNYNNSGYDRTKWYAFKDEQCIIQNVTMEGSECDNRKSRNGQPLPDSKPNKKPDSKQLVQAPKTNNGTSLYNTMMKTFEAVSGAMDNYAKEGKNLKLIIKHCEVKAGENGDTPEEVAHQVLATFQHLREHDTKFWQDQPFTPSALNSLFSRVYVQVEKLKKKLVGEQETLERMRDFEFQEITKK